MLGRAATHRAIDHLIAFGDTDIFPRLPELEFFKDRKEDIAKELEGLSVGSYAPQSACEMLVPKSAKSFRIAHQLTAIDSLIYLTSVIENAGHFEETRVPATESVACSYRFIVGEGPRLFQKDGGFHDWLIKLAEFGGSGGAADLRMVVETDISDFYSRIYFHRVENILDSCPNKKAASFTKKIIKAIRSNQSFGIPVGQSASRILAESILDDIDKFLIEDGVAHSRYVDDFRIITENQQLAHATLCKLAEHLMVSEGLSLNGEKTHFHSVTGMQKEAKERLDDVFNTVDRRKFDKLIRISYHEDESLDDGEDDVASLIFFDGDDLVDKITEMDEYGGKEISSFRALFKLIRLLGNAKPSKLKEIDDRFLYLLPRDFCLTYSPSIANTKEEKIEAKARIISLLGELPFRDLALCRYWLLDVFVRGAAPCEWSDFRDYDFSKSTPEKRAEYLLRGRLGQSSYFRSKKTKFGELNDWEKPAFLLGAMALPRDEYHKWVTSVEPQLSWPCSKLYCSWLKDMHGDLERILTYQA